MPRKVTASELSLVDASLEIAARPDAVERAFMARELVQCTLPHRDPGNVPVWVRQNGNLLLGLQPGPNLDTGETLGYPYGTIPRLLLYWLISEAVRRKNLPQKEARRIELTGDRSTMADFMREVGLDPNTGGGKRSDAVRLRQQMDRLFSCRIALQEATFRTRKDGAQSRPTMFMEIAPSSDIWWNPKQASETPLFGSWIELGEKFFEAVTAAPVPLDLRVIRALKQSPLALDLYGWACHRAYTVNKSGKPARISWQALMDQMGTDYANVDEFARKARASLLKVIGCWRKNPSGQTGLNLSFVKGGLLLSPGSVLSVPEAAPVPDLLPPTADQLTIQDAIAEAHYQKRRAARPRK